MTMKSRSRAEQRDHDLDDPLAWGYRLISTRDIDPIYDMLVNATKAGDLGECQRARWLVAYWCCYHAGVASHVSQFAEKSFWTEMEAVARNVDPPPEGCGPRWPRATERRHWRGRAAIDCVETLRHKFPSPELMVDYPVDNVHTGLRLEYVQKRIQEWPSFGPWISFKVADMLERVLGYAIDFPESAVMYDSPREGLAAMKELTGANTETEIIQAMGEMYDHLQPPGRNTRHVGFQEYETVFCKWKSARNGHYFIGKDLLEVRHALDGWGTTAEKLLKHLPPPLNETR